LFESGYETIQFYAVYRVEGRNLSPTLKIAPILTAYLVEEHPPDAGGDGCDSSLF
jgi:hypothetical protein